MEVVFDFWFLFSQFMWPFFFFSQTHGTDGFEKHFSLRAMLPGGCGAACKQVGPPASCESH